MKLGDKLKSVRKSKGISLKELWKATGEQVSISFLSDIENGRSNPSIDNLKIIANALDTPVSYFIEDASNSLFGTAVEDLDFIPIAELLKDFKYWNIEDKNELLYYLKAKKVIRDN